MAQRRSSSLHRTVEAVSAGLIGAGLMGGIGYTHGTGMILGTLAGAVLVGALGYGIATGLASPITLSAVLFALFFGMIGPGYDDYAGHAVVPAACFGAFVGWLFRGHRRRDP
jgi:hypothetical protein